MSKGGPRAGAASGLERLLAALAAVACSLISVAAWRSVSPHQEMWPLPGAYFIELPIVALATAAAFAAGARYRSAVAWIALGIFTAFAVLGAFSVGMAYAPVALLLAGVAISSDLREARALSIHVGICLVAAMVQTALMLLLIRVLYP